MRPVAGQIQCDAFSNAPAAAGDDRDLSCQLFLLPGDKFGGFC
jgi:hypothetical protein